MGWGLLGPFFFGRAVAHHWVQEVCVTPNDMPEFEGKHLGCLFVLVFSFLRGHHIKGQKNNKICQEDLHYHIST